MRWFGASPRRATPKGHETFISCTAAQRKSRLLTYDSSLRAWRTNAIYRRLFRLRRLFHARAWKTLPNQKILHENSAVGPSGHRHGGATYPPMSEESWKLRPATDGKLDRHTWRRALSALEA